MTTEEKILEIFKKYFVDPKDSDISRLLDFKDSQLAAKEIAALYNKELAFEIACNPDVMEAETNYKMYQEQIDNYKKLIEAQDELINAFKHRMSFIDTDELEDNLIEQIGQLRKEIEK
jgi:hypothetical protein